MSKANENANGFFARWRSPKNAVPLISWAHANHWSTLDCPYLTDDAQVWYPVDDSYSANSYALRVHGESMLAPAGTIFGRSYPDGSVIFVDPDRRAPKNGEHVIAVLSSSSDLVFRVFRSTATMRWLEPLALYHRASMEEFAVIGTVIGMRKL